MCVCLMVRLTTNYNVFVSGRSDIVEPYLCPQWYFVCISCLSNCDYHCFFVVRWVKMKDMANDAVTAVKTYARIQSNRMMMSLAWSV
jgi:hypothetical protein